MIIKISRHKEILKLEFSCTRDKKTFYFCHKKQTKELLHITKYLKSLEDWNKIDASSMVYIFFSPFRKYQHAYACMLMHEVSICNTSRGYEMSKTINSAHCSIFSSVSIKILSKNYLIDSWFSSTKREGIINLLWHHVFPPVDHHNNWCIILE